MARLEDLKRVLEEEREEGARYGLWLEEEGGAVGEEASKRRAAYAEHACQFREKLNQAGRLRGRQSRNAPGFTSEEGERHRVALSVEWALPRAGENYVGLLICVEVPL